VAFKRGDKVETANGWVGKVTFTDTARKLVAVKATEDGVGHSKGDEDSFRESEVRKA
jgi:hypothetical protein